MNMKELKDYFKKCSTDRLDKIIALIDDMVWQRGLDKTTKTFKYPKTVALPATKKGTTMKKDTKKTKKATVKK